MMHDLFVKTHEAWLAYLFGSHALGHSALGAQFEDFSDFLFRHMGFIEQESLNTGNACSYERATMPLAGKTHGEIARYCLKYLDPVKRSAAEMEACELKTRLTGDLDFIASETRRHAEAADPVTAFDRGLELPDIRLDQTSREALIRFLFEECYKEYELIVIYAHARAHCSQVRLRDIFATLVGESRYHMRAFATLMAQLGILSIPRPVNSEIYTFVSMRHFLQQGIQEEMDAKVACLELAASINSERLQRFFECINAQESYHIGLMKEALNFL